MTFLQFKEDKRKLEVTAEFNRLSVMFMRLDETSGIKTARKVSTATNCLVPDFKLPLVCCTCIPVMQLNETQFYLQNI